MYQIRAFTLLELMVTLAIAATLLAVGVPSFTTYLQNQRMSQASYRLVSDLRFARQSAVDQNARVVICPGKPESGCADSPHWEDGWILFTDSNGDRHKQPDEALLRVSPMLKGLSARSSNARRRLSFFPDGSAPGSNATLRLCDSRGPGHARQVLINLAGRIRTIRANGNDPMAC